MTEAVGLVKARRHFLLHGQREFQRHRRDGIDKQLAHGGVNAGSHNGLTVRIPEEPAPADTDIVGGHAVFADGVLHMHAAAAETTDRVSLQESRTFSCRPGVSFESDRLGGCTELLFVAFIVLPGDVRRMGVLNQHVPLVWRQTLPPAPSIGLLAPAGTAKGLGSRVPRIVHRSTGTAQRQRRPDQFMLVCARRHPGGVE